MEGVGGTKHIGIGGAFKVVEGRVKAHGLPAVEADAILKPGELMNKLPVYEAGPDLTCVGLIVSGDPTEGKFGTFQQHWHFFKPDGTEGGHFEEGVTKEEMKYVGFFTLASTYCTVNQGLGK